MKLSDIAEVRTGLVLSRRAAEGTDADYIAYPQLNLKCISEDATIDRTLLDTFQSAEALDPKYLTSINDIVVRLTVPNTAVLIQEGYVGLVVSSHFSVVRARDGKAIPGYLAWFLNSDIARSQIAKGVTGTSYAAIRPGFIGELDIKPLSLAEQTKMADAYITGQYELRLLEQLQQEKLRQYRMVLEKYYRKIGR